MPSRYWLFRIHDILEAINKIQKYTQDMEFNHFAADRKTVDAVIRNMIIIGEAASHIPEEICQTNSDIPWQDMRAMRNFIVHEYFGVSDNILWDTVKVDLPSLIPLLISIKDIRERT